jgi:deoxyguanosine kinase
MNTPGGKYICIEGNIGAGKTTIARILSEDWKAFLVLEAFADNPFLPIFYQDPDRYAFPVEVHFLMERHRQLLEEIFHQNIFSSIVVADYCPHKSLIFGRQTLQEQEFRLYKTLFNTLLYQIRMPDLVVYIHRSTDWLLKSIRKRGRSYELDIKKDYLMQLQESYELVFSQEKRFPILWINAFDTDYISDKAAREKLKELIQKTYKPGLHKIEWN